MANLANRKPGHHGIPRVMGELPVQPKPVASASAASAHSKARAPNRRATIATAVAAVLLTGSLLLLHRNSSEILFNTRAIDVSFTVASPYAPFRGIAGLSSLAVKGWSTVRQDGAPDAFSRDDDEQLYQVNAVTGAGHHGSIGIDDLVVPRDTQIEYIGIDTGAATILLHFPPKQAATLNLAIAGSVVTSVVGGEKRELDSPSPTDVAIALGDSVQLDLRYDSKNLTFPTPVEVRGVAWNRDRPTDPNTPGGVVRESSILSGKISLEEFKDRYFTIHNGEMIDLGASTGYLRQLSTDGLAFTCQFDGSVSVLTVGAGKREKNYMPTWLDWLRSRDALLLFWMSSAYIVGLVLAIDRWWKGAE